MGMRATDGTPYGTLAVEFDEGDGSVVQPNIRVRSARAVSGPLRYGTGVEHVPADRPYPAAQD